MVTMASALSSSSEPTISFSSASTSAFDPFGGGAGVLRTRGALATAVFASAFLTAAFLTAAFAAGAFLAAAFLAGALGVAAFFAAVFFGAAALGAAAFFFAAGAAVVFVAMVLFPSVPDVHSQPGVP